MGPIAKFRLGQERFEKLERDILMRKTFHVEIDECAEFFGAAQDRTQLWREMRDSVGRVGRIDLRVKSGDFHREIDHGK